MLVADVGAPFGRFPETATCLNQVGNPRMCKTARISDRSSRTPMMSAPSGAGRSNKRTASPFWSRRARTNASSPRTSTPLRMAAEYFCSNVRAVRVASWRCNANSASGERSCSASSATLRLGTFDRCSSCSSCARSRVLCGSPRSCTNALTTVGVVAARTTSRTFPFASARHRRTNSPSNARTSSATRASPSVERAYVLSIIFASEAAGIATTSTDASTATRRSIAWRTSRGTGSTPRASIVRSSAAVMDGASVTGRTFLPSRQRPRLG